MQECDYITKHHQLICIILCIPAHTYMGDLNVSFSFNVSGFQKDMIIHPEEMAFQVCGKKKCNCSNAESENLIDLLPVAYIYHVHSISHSLIPHVSIRRRVSNCQRTLIWKVNKLISSGGMHGCRVRICCLSARPLWYIWLDKKLPMAAHLKRAG